MASFLIAHLPFHSKSLEAVEFLQKNDFFFRLSTNEPLMNFLLFLLSSGGGGGSRLAAAMGLPEEFELGKEEISVINGLPYIFPPENKVEVDEERVIKEEDDVSESGQPNNQNPHLEINSIGAQTEESVEVPLSVPRNPSPTVVMDVGQAEDELVDEHQIEEENPLNDNELQMENGEELDISVGELLGATDADVSMILQPLALLDDDFPAYDVTHDKVIAGDEEEIVEHGKGDDEEMEDDENMEEFEEEEEELIEEHEYDEKEEAEENEEQRDKNSDRSDIDEEEEEASNEEEDSLGEEDKNSDEQDEESNEGKDAHRLGNLVGRLIFTCPSKNCPSSFNTFNNLRDHMKIHSGKQNFFCDVCKKSFSSIEAAIAHIQERKMKKCCGCGKKISFHFLEHLRSHTGEKPFVCKTCGKTFVAFGTLNRHVLVHTGERPYKCSRCDYRCSQRANLKSHILTHTGDKPYSCGQCEKRFAHKNRLKTHEMTHTGEKPHECSHCGHRFNDRSNLNKHIRIHIGQKQFFCKKCDEKFTQSGTLKRHMERKHKS